MRAIDADVMLAELKPIDYEAEHSTVLISDVAKIMREWVERQPTLTPPNEPLTLEKLREMGGQPYWHVGLREESPPPHWNILDPFCAKRIEDYKYGENWIAYRRPPEGEEDT